uniref:Uncharacterized protein n=1 Tax=Anguilla anguilla TaxID=7936 RepID=A0A0E9WL22_ANGAN
MASLFCCIPSYFRFLLAWEWKLSAHFINSLSELGLFISNNFILQDKKAVVMKGMILL